jgi:hypothetical protein
MILFNPCTSIDSYPSDPDLEIMEEIKVLGITITSDMVTKANKKTKVF